MSRTVKHEPGSTRKSCIKKRRRARRNGLAQLPTWMRHELLNHRNPT